MTIWDNVTGNSSLSVEAGTTLYDHLNNQQGGNGVSSIVDGVKVILNNDSRNQILSTSVSRTIVHAII